jgi:4-hydroxybenzoate polyprenyltransferase
MPAAEPRPLATSLLRRPAVSAYVACIRFPEVLVLQGSPLLGAAFALREITAARIAVGALFAAASFLLVAHIWSFNDWAGAAADLEDPNKSRAVFSTRGVSPRGLLGFSFILLASSLGLFLFLPARTFLIAVAIAGLGMLYSHPAVSAKTIPVLSSLPHLAGGLLHFLLGYSVYEAIDGRGLAIALFFALTFAAGHLNQEVRDHAGDRRSGLRTSAVAFGPARAFAASLLLFTLAYADLVLLAYAGIVPRILAVPPLVLYPFQLVWSVRTLRAGLDFESVVRFQRRYRLLYALIGLSMLAVLALRFST